MSGARRIDETHDLAGFRILRPDGALEFWGGGETKGPRNVKTIALGFSYSSAKGSGVFLLSPLPRVDWANGKAILVGR